MTIENRHVMEQLRRIAFRTAIEAIGADGVHLPVRQWPYARCCLTARQYDMAKDAARCEQDVMFDAYAAAEQVLIEQLNYGRPQIGPL